MGPDRKITFHCRRHPPQLVVLPRANELGQTVGINVTPLWPIVRAEDNCADYLPKSTVLSS